MQKKKTTKINAAPPFAISLNRSAIAAQIKDATKGPFYTSAQVKEMLKKRANDRAETQA